MSNNKPVKTVVDSWNEKQREEEYKREQEVRAWEAQKNIEAQERGERNNMLAWAFIVIAAFVMGASIF